MKNVVKCCKDFNTLETHRTTLSQDISSNFIQKLLNTMCRLFQMILFPNNCAKSLSMKIFVLKKRFMDSHFAHYFGDMTSTKISSCKKAFFTWNEKYFFRMFIKPFWWRSPMYIKMYCRLREGPAFKNNTLENYAAEKTKKNIPSHFLQSTQYYTCIK